MRFLRSSIYNFLLCTEYIWSIGLPGTKKISIGPTGCELGLSCVYWVCAGRGLFHAEYTQEAVFFMLSIDWTWQRIMEDRPFHTEYSSDNVLRILSMKKTTSCVYSVWKRGRPAYTQYEKDHVLRILSMVPRKTFALCLERSCVYSVWKYGVLRILSKKKMMSCLYSVWKRPRPAYTQYE